MINKNKEVGGTHYSDMQIEPVELIEAMNLNFIQGNIVKYISRYKTKGNPVGDLKKALHYCKMSLGKYIECEEMPSEWRLLIKMYCAINKLTEIECLIIAYVALCKFNECANEIDKLISKAEEK